MDSITTKWGTSLQSLLTMTADQYLHGILLREAVDAGPNSPLLGLQATLMPTLRQWAGDNLLGVYPSGSFMKGTAVRSGTDIDLFLSLSEHTNETLKEVYNKLFDCLTSAGYSPKRQNVSLNITVSRYSVDLVPGKRQNALSGDHSLYRRKADTWTKTSYTCPNGNWRGTGKRDTHFEAVEKSERARFPVVLSGALGHPRSLGETIAGPLILQPSADAIAASHDGLRLSPRLISGSQNRRSGQHQQHYFG